MGGKTFSEKGEEVCLFLEAHPSAYNLTHPLFSPFISVVLLFSILSIHLSVYLCFYLSLVLFLLSLSFIPVCLTTQVRAEARRLSTSATTTAAGVAAKAKGNLEQQQPRGDAKEGGREVVNPLQKKQEARTPYENMEMATKLIKPEGEEQEDKNKQWHTPTKDGRTKPSGSREEKKKGVVLVEKVGEERKAKEKVVIIMQKVFDWKTYLSESVVLVYISAHFHHSPFISFLSIYLIPSPFTNTATARAAEGAAAAARWSEGGRGGGREPAAEKGGGPNAVREDGGGHQADQARGGGAGG